MALPDVVPELVHGEAARDRETREEGAQPRPKYHGHHSTSTYNLLSRLRRPTRSFVLSSFEEGRSPSIAIAIAYESRDHTLSLSQQRARPHGEAEEWSVSLRQARSIGHKSCPDRDRRYLSKRGRAIAIGQVWRRGRMGYPGRGQRGRGRGLARGNRGVSQERSPGADSGGGHRSFGRLCHTGLGPGGRHTPSAFSRQ